MASFLSRLTGGGAEPGWVTPEDLAPVVPGSSPVIIDVRGPAEFTGPLGHIPGARNVPLDEIPAHTAALAGEAEPIVLVCHTDRRSSAAAVHLRAAGVANVTVLQGGMVAWHRAGLPRG
jgi:rhodanese-related sulfurtransferase